MDWDLSAEVAAGETVSSFDEIKSAGNFVDIRMARGGYQQRVPIIWLRRAQGWLGYHVVDETIHETLATRDPTHVAGEIEK